VSNRDADRTPEEDQADLPAGEPDSDPPLVTGVEEADQEGFGGWWGGGSNWETVMLYEMA
jgi:hypothetical protein